MLAPVLALALVWVLAPALALVLALAQVPDRVGGPSPEPVLRAGLWFHRQSRHHHRLPAPHWPSGRQAWRLWAWGLDAAQAFRCRFPLQPRQSLLRKAPLLSVSSWFCQLFVTCATPCEELSNALRSKGLRIGVPAMDARASESSVWICNSEPVGLNRYE